MTAEALKPQLSRSNAWPSVQFDLQARVASAIVSKGEPGGGVAAESEGQRSGSATDAGADPTALGIALGGASRSKADAFLERQAILVDKQIALSDLQIEDLKREDAVRPWSLRIHHISDILKLGFELAAAAVVTAFVVFIGAAVWSAAHDNGLVIEAFNVPADMAANGLSGQVIATQIQDHLASMQANTDTIRQPAPFATISATTSRCRFPIPESPSANSIAI